MDSAGSLIAIMKAVVLTSPLSSSTEAMLAVSIASSVTGQTVRSNAPSVKIKIRLKSVTQDLSIVSGLCEGSSRGTELPRFTLMVALMMVSCTPSKSVIT